MNPLRAFIEIVVIAGMLAGAFYAGHATGETRVEVCALGRKI